jgi:hypothetical protein
LATLKLSPLLVWVNVARPAVADELVHPGSVRPARARKPAKSDDVVPQARFGLETVLPPAGREAFAPSCRSP